MSWRAAADEIVTYVRETYAPIGIVIAGSLVRGDGGPHSDLDVCIVHAAPWRLREQRRVRGVPAELFVNPPAQVRRYFEREHADGRPCTAHMFATGEPVAPVDAEIEALVREARAWLTRPVEITDAALTQKRYAAVDYLDDARDVIDRDPVAAALLLADTVRAILAYAAWRDRRFQPRRKDPLAGLDPTAAALVRAWESTRGLAAVEELARHVLGIDTFFPWISDRDPTDTARG